MKLDAAIIGGGVVGAAVARVLSRYHLSVAVFEKCDDICMGASKANTGIVHSGYDAKPGTQKALFNVAGAKMYPALCAELGVPYKKCGALVIAFTKEEQVTLSLLRDRGCQNGTVRLSIISGDEARALEPALSQEVIAALHVPKSGVVSPYEMTFALMEHAAVNGVKVYTREKVLRVDRQADGFLLTTEHHCVTAGTVINCAGIGAAAVRTALVGDTVRLIPRKGEYHLLDNTGYKPFTRTIFQCPSVMGKGVVITPTAHGNTLIGPTAMDVKDGEDVATTADALKEALDKGRRTWPQISTRTAIASFAGIRAHPVSDDFIVGHTQTGFFEAIGIESPGLTAAPAIGEHLGKAVAAYLKAGLKEHIITPCVCRKPFREMNFKERGEAWREDPTYGTVVCRCEHVTEAEIKKAIHAPVGAGNIDAVKRRTRAGMGRCQGGFCGPRVLDILSDELAVSPMRITKFGEGSELLTKEIRGGDI
ncbi:MAG: NAD(P)/FAD-dependent oxidoreductase [Clostridia bacterium]|nr:NAD(P)/FAD-dependent oxidoreductase [Clostridia bacterium]